MRPLLSITISLLARQTLSANNSNSNSTLSSNSIPTNLNSSLSAVCTPLECIQGVNSLSAGTTIITPTFNGSSRATVLLPGTYTTTSSSQANTSSLIFDSTSTFINPAGFSSSGSLGSAFTVSLLPGLITYTLPLFEGTANYLPISNTSLSNSSTINSNSKPISSFLISDNVWVIMNIGISPSVRTVVWKGVSDVGNLGVSTSGGISILDMQSSNCPIPCASGGICGSSSSCICKAGFTGATCNACSAGFYGPNCLPCALGCASCDSGITGTGRCLPVQNLNATAAACNCINGVCASNLPTATCACNAGWGVAGNGTQCGACATGYYPSASGDCLACDASCASCSGPTGTCLTCQLSLQPLSTDPTKCTTANSALANGTFISCPARTFFQHTTSSCVACNPLCDTCWNGTPSGCLSCRTPNALLGGGCVGFNPSNGVCDSIGYLVGGVVAGSNAGWVIDNVKAECDALPAKCTAGAIDNFSTASTRSQLTCSACLAGTFLSGGKCLTSCPTGTTASTDGKTCVACDPSCLSCSGSPTFCTACANPTKLTLNGSCIPGPSCPLGYFTATGNSTCLACHPDCATCGPTFDKCLSCPSTRPILSPSTSTCLQTCTSSQFYDSSKSSCTSCSSSCDTCSGAGDGACLSCSSTTVLKQGSCVAAKCSLVVPYFGVCLSSLVTVSATSVNSTSTTSTVLPWWTILLIVLGCLILVGLAGLIFRRKEQKRRRLQTARFADDLGQKEVDLKLQALPSRIAYPSLPITREQEDFEEELRNSNVPLTPPFVGRMEEERDRGSYRWSAGSDGSSRIGYPKPLIPQQTGASVYSQNTVVSNKSLPWGSHNPYNR